MGLESVQHSASHASTKPRNPYPRVSSLAAAFALAIVPAGCRDTPPPRTTHTIIQPGIEEPSGIVYVSAFRTLFVVGDEGAIAEMCTDGSVVRAHQIPGNPDIEGITYSPETGFLYLVEEGPDHIIELDPVDFSIQRRISVPRSYHGQLILPPGGTGLEGITWMPSVGHSGLTFVLANQGSISAHQEAPAFLVITFPLPTAASHGVVADIDRCLQAPRSTISDIWFDPVRRLLWSVSDTDNLITLSSLTDGAVHAQIALPGRAQEGLACDLDGNLYIAQDTGGVLVMPAVSISVPSP